MKAMQISALALAISLFSCTKESPSLLEEGRQSSSQVNQNAQGGSNGQESVMPSLTVVYSANPAVAGTPVTVTGKLDPQSGETAPTCGKLELMQWNGTEFVAIGGGLQAEIENGNQQVTYTFTPTNVGNDTYAFQVKYIKGGCAGYKTTHSSAYYLDVIAPCTVGITGTSSASATPDANGMYTFTVNFTVNTCELEFDKYKIQGGVTNGTSDVTEVGSAGTMTYWVPGGSSNQVTKWEEQVASPAILDKSTRTYSLSFKKAWDGQSPITLTGNWSVSMDRNGLPVSNLSIAPIVHQP